MKKAIKKSPKTLGERIRFLRGDLTQTRFAEILNIKQAMISRYEADKETPSPKILLRLSEYSSKPMEWLLTGHDSVSASAGETKIKELGEKATKKMSKEDLVEVAAGYIQDTHIPEAEEFVEMMKNCLLDREKVNKLLDYYKYIKFEEKSK